MPRGRSGVRERVAPQVDELLAWRRSLPEGVREVEAEALSELDRRLDQLETLTDTDALLLAEAGLLTAMAALAARRPDAGVPVRRPNLAGAVRTTLARLESRYPGHLVEVRVPPFAAVQIGMPGVAGGHRRGTPPNVVETDAATWLRLAGGDLGWADAVAHHQVSASGAHVQLDDLLPLR